MTERDRGWWGRLSHDRRVVVTAVLAAIPGVALALVLLWTGDYGARLQWTLTVVLVGAWGVATNAVRDQVVRPLQTLSTSLRPSTAPSIPPSSRRGARAGRR